ncbi:hypothetical protein H6G17_10625 [Chroococcidiopsis sp. FACHB-1243]|uniref:hypothetical protein n=1 Tax=Chroococcidiopsis sp. [FACHB-1243] TaxID=2692781 RepID=UPI001783F55B|nr:hypothetical protein [Chroococcidiopsis sp. [FACHB-1243]]MBD2305966.1 hypothetical protein [Chroococcidiopsis sp. [FACHB-1243]]
MISKPAQTEGFRSIIAGLILASVTAYLLIVVGKNETISGTDQVLIIISGMTTVAALSAFDRFIERNQKTSSPVDEILFDEVLISKGFIEIATSESRSAQKDEVSVPQSLPWDLSLNQLVGVDNSLALAQLRIEIERQLRRIAYEHKIDISIRPIGIVGLAQELVYREYIPAAWLEVLREINTVCSRAIHGLEISDEQANSVLRVGGQMLEQLRLVVLK